MEQGSMFVTEYEKCFVLLASFMADLNLAKVFGGYLSPHIRDRAFVLRLRKLRDAVEVALIT